MKKKYKELYTYCGLNNRKENIVAKIGSNEIVEWKWNYRSSFKKSYVSSFEKLDVQEYYCDPDQTYKKGYDHKFFYQLVKFLNKKEEEFNKREEEFKDKLNGKFKYIFEENNGIKVFEIVKKDNGSEDENELFYLSSDQLGFSAPSNEKEHPYDLYIKQQCKCDVIEQVTEWIISSRTIGGSFLWPTPFYTYYNRARGGTIKSDRSHYIQDRVDLTLWEIYYLYQKINRIKHVGKNTIMESCMESCNKRFRNKDNGNLTKWLDHFKDFQTYVQFFCFCDFVRKEEDEYKPVDLFTGQINEPQWGEQGEHPEVQIKDDVDPDELVEMLEQLNDKILSRSQEMEKIINNENESI